MHNIERKLLEKGIIDSDLTTFSIGDWYSNVKISFIGNEENQVVSCIFDECFEVDFKHDLSYSKGKNGSVNNFKYFVQDIEINEQGEYFYCSISAWPFQGKIVCKNISIKIEST